jgi:hypothetical protein
MVIENVAAAAADSIVITSKVHETHRLYRTQQDTTTHDDISDMIYTFLGTTDTDYVQVSRFLPMGYDSSYLNPTDPILDLYRHFLDSALSYQRSPEAAKKNEIISYLDDEKNFPFFRFWNVQKQDTLVENSFGDLLPYWKAELAMLLTTNPIPYFKIQELKISKTKGLIAYDVSSTGRYGSGGGYHAVLETRR